MAAPAKRVSKDPEIRKAEIIEAAAGLFQEKGFAATSTQDIVKKVGVSHGTLFYHFPTKQDVLIALGKARLRTFHATLRGWLRDESMTPRQKLLRVLSHIDSMRNIRMAMEDLGMGFIRQDIEVHNTLVNLAVPLFIDDMEALVNQGISEREFTVANPRGTALCIMLLSADLIHRADVTRDLVKWPVLSAAFRSGVLAMLGARPE